ncbi:MAG: DedA family protein [Gammaproteobacteria bacterium]|nr:DedA family protein [Gammaproteobacteria bacterium]
MDEFTSLWGLFFSAFISSTIAPGGSEVLLAYLVNEKQIPNHLLLSVSTLGNTLGAMLTWCMGYFAATRFPLNKKHAIEHPHALALIQRWGRFSLFFSWLPLIGDALCLLAGWLRFPLLSSVMIIAVGKALRYGAIIYIMN